MFQQEQEEMIVEILEVSGNEEEEILEGSKNEEEEIVEQGAAASIRSLNEERTKLQEDARTAEENLVRIRQEIAHVEAAIFLRGGSLH